MRVRRQKETVELATIEIFTPRGRRIKNEVCRKYHTKKIAASQQEAERYNWSRSMLQWDLRRNNCASLLQYLHTKIRIL